MDRPVFLWWAHKELWDILATHPNTEHEDAAVTVARKYHTKWPFSGCYACQAKQELVAANRSERTCYSCEKYCPIDWGKSVVCVESSDSPYVRWRDAHYANKPGLAAKYAAQIRDLPLRENAREIYDVKESPDD